MANDVISSSIIFNAANEVAVQSFLDYRLNLRHYHGRRIVDKNT